jgi:aminopeptidase 2
LDITDQLTNACTDAGVLAASGYQKTSGTLSLLHGFKSESSYVVWDEIITRILALRNAWVFENEETKNALKKFQLDLVGPKAKEMGWTFKETDGHVEQQFKALLFGAAGDAGDPEVIKAAFDMFARFKGGDRSAIHPNIRGSVYSLCLSNGGAEEYDVILNEALTANTSDERNTAMRAIGKAKSPELIQRTLTLPLGDKVKAQDIYLPISGLRAHAEGITALWSWFKANWNELVARLPPGLSMLSSVVSICTASFTHEDQLKDVQNFFKDRQTKGFDQSLAQALDAIRAKQSWLQRDSDDVKTWLKENGYFGK